MHTPKIVGYIECRYCGECPVWDDEGVGWRGWRKDCPTDPGAFWRKPKLLAA